MPHEAKYLDKEYQDRKQSKIDADLARTKRIQAINNRILLCAINCPKLRRTPETCRVCDEKQKGECVEAFELKKAFELEEGIK